jgi:hypothetical protein
MGGGSLSQFLSFGAFNGQSFVRGRSSDDGGGVGSLVFYYSTDQTEVDNNGATLLSETDTPQIYPVTRIHQVALAKVEQNGDLTPVVAGDFVGSGQKLITRAARARSRDW